MSKTQFQMKCPGDKCNNDQISQWQHNGCGGIISINELGNLSCDKCYASYDFFEWRFGCGQHMGDYQKPDYNKILNNLINDASLKNKMGIDWLIKLTSNISRSAKSRNFL